MNELFRERWLKRFGLPSKNWRKEVGRHVRSLPFADPKTSLKLLVALFQTVPRRLPEQPGIEDARLAEAFGWCCFSFWQCGSAFPSYPEDYAQFLLQEFLKNRSKRSSHGSAIAQMILSAGAADGRAGFNALTLRDAPSVLESERCVLTGDYERYLKATAKYREYEARLRADVEFRRDWDLLKRMFRRRLSGRGIIHRSLIPERNWLRQGAARFSNESRRFQAAFDLFCWKYFLWGMKKGEPLLLKPSVVFTPFGTQIFVPGYMSFDPKRDLDLRRIGQLHKARGVLRQGAKMSSGREELAERVRKAELLNQQAKANGLKGERRYQFIADGLRIRTGADFRQVRFLLQSNQPSSKSHA